ncbi:serine/threonine protein kinase [Lodderomyces elongisporus]|uniref:serine/threonine protein kinase n=1 Tax=Lodderomyces elongisporus TaxID=36914 RepID=UPI0029201796|nr:serine/threonine protein kinase [Lodderomyces elongisporus]WLF81039.1 serine/threonine protein kinase [Lodderomyces elongisporus]
MNDESFNMPTRLEKLFIFHKLIENEPSESHTAKRQATIVPEIIAKIYSIRNHPTLSIPHKSRVTIGRSSSCDVRIQGLDVSSKHCEMNLITLPQSDSQMEYLNIVDLSSNGLYINDEKLGKGSKVILKTGDKIAFAKTGGTYIFRYMGDDLPEGSQVKKQAFFDEYIIGKQLGSGHYAVVKEAKSKRTGEIVAVKVFHPNKSSSGSGTQDKKLQQEMDLLLSINHPNIVQYRGHYIEPNSSGSVNTYLVLEKMNSGELFQRIINKTKLGVNETRAIFKQLLSGLKYLHDQNIIHRDIKPENILLDVVSRTNPDQEQLGPWDENELDVVVKIADFGLAKFIGELKFTNTLCGTPAYVAPEILRLESKRSYSTKVDLWSSGVLLYVCLSGFPPFSDELAPPNMKEQILEGKYAFYSPFFDDISDTVLDLITNLLRVDPEERFNIDETLGHEWFTELE